jgi:hypothetical protein
MPAVITGRFNKYDRYRQLILSKLKAGDYHKSRFTSYVIDLDGDHQSFGIVELVALFGDELVIGPCNNA